jgi:glycosyltransferase involved in cell wall biosynthesis
MKIAVYTIALNEEQFVKRWYESAKDADYILIADTGSTDKTKELADELGINLISISISPWRFDDARNAALASLPADVDYCIALDMDEVLLPGWRKELEQTFEKGITRPRYKYTWSWKEDGTPGLQYGGDKIHLRRGYRWRHPVHEVLGTDRLQETQEWIGLEIHHYPDNTKSRSQYLDLLELSVKEDPHDDRNAYYYARELFFNGRIEEATSEFKRHLALPTAVWAPERAASYRYLAKCENEKVFEHLENAIKEDPNRREAHVEYALAAHDQQMWEECMAHAAYALSIEEKPLDYLCEEFAWGSVPHDLMALSAHNLGLKDVAKAHGNRAVELSPEDERLKNNLTFYSQ